MNQLTINPALIVGIPNGSMTQEAHAKLPNESIMQFYYRISGGHQARNNNEHSAATGEALQRAVNAGVATYTAIPNGDGTIHKYTFELEADYKGFAAPTGDVFNQYVYTH